MFRRIAIIAMLCILLLIIMLCLGGLNEIIVYTPAEKGIPISDEEFVREHKIGIGLTWIPDTFIRDCNYDIYEGAYVSYVGSNTPAKKAGIRRNDIIARVNGIYIKDADHLYEVSDNLNPGLVKVLVIRNCQPRTIYMQLLENP